MRGVERKIDNLGRIVIPISHRKALGLSSEDTVTISLESDKIIISPKKLICACCGQSLDHTSNMRICQSCISYIKENENG